MSVSNINRVYVKKTFGNWGRQQKKFRIFRKICQDTIHKCVKSNQWADMSIIFLKLNANLAKKSSLNANAKFGGLKLCQDGKACGGNEFQSTYVQDTKERMDMKFFPD